MKIYTKQGDKGETGLIGDRRISKASLRIEAYGSVDELNAILGVAGARLSESQLDREIELIQNELHIICADLASPDLSLRGPRIEAVHVERLEKLCDKLDQKLEPLKQFILPGGSLGGAVLHFARTVARRAERRTTALADEEDINPDVLRYLNRLSDLLFLMARIANHEDGVPEVHPKY